MADLDLKSVTTYERGIVGGALVAFIGLFFPAYGVSAGPFSAHVSGWHFVGLWLPTLLLVAAAALVAIRRLRGDLLPELPIGTRVIVAGVAVVALLWVVIRALTYPGGNGSGLGVGISVGASWGTYVVCIATAVAAAFAVLDLRASGEQIPSMPVRPSGGESVG